MELIVVIAILGILAAVAIPAYNGYITKAKEAADIAICDAIKTAAIATKAETMQVKYVKITTGNNGDIVAGENSTNATSIKGDDNFKMYSGYDDGELPTFHNGISSATWDASANNGAWKFEQ